MRLVLATALLLSACGMSPQSQDDLQRAVCGCEHSGLSRAECVSRNTTTVEGLADAQMVHLAWGAECTSDGEIRNPRNRP